jgi:hypothetical protein
MNKYYLCFVVFVLLSGISICSAQPPKLKAPKNIEEFKQKAVEDSLTGEVSIQVLDRVLRDLRLLHPEPNDRASIAFRGELAKYHDYLISVGIELFYMRIGKTLLQLVPVSRADTLNTYQYYAVGGMELLMKKVPAKAFLEVAYTDGGLVKLKYWVEDTADKLEGMQATINATPGLSGFPIKELVATEFKRALELLKCRVHEISTGRKCPKD